MTKPQEAVQAAAKEETLNSPSKLLKVVVWALDALSAVVLLALAILGGQKLLQASLDSNVKIGITVFIVGLLASRLTEKVFSK